MSTEYPVRAAAKARTLTELETRLVRCRACPRLVAWREETALAKRPAFADWEYWGRPVPGFGPADAAMMITGLAPAAHGANRTGRMFTGDRAGDLLYATLYELGLASQATATGLDDGLELYGVRVTAPVHCAPPANRPTTGERDTCRVWLVREAQLMQPTLRSVVVLGTFGWQAALSALEEAGWSVPPPRPAFGHGVRTTLTPAGPTGAEVTVFGCYHVSQRNVFTGRLTPAMLRQVLAEAAYTAGLPVERPGPG
ncbi:uracil-DNA glycosylase [Streptomyces virginiae]|uniref:uracil-DNA glycosylase n=1 Tax=Streptomyces TaxID=1883 RepID=UPI000689E810|nr:MULTISPECIES: uracil-DNA glycosylase [Streptomyces]MCX4718230.1 uracil-DNA glycosylase [Streptomyces virginiae]WSX97072.1 uracil-DNA glycosylase [Streptomyces goshikiensis]